MTNPELADLLEEAARRLRKIPGGSAFPWSRYVTVEEYAKAKNLHPVTVRNQCRAGSRIIARRSGRSWEIDIKRTEELQSLKFGNPAERDLVRRR
jgi:hypothetical protein